MLTEKQYKELLRYHRDSIQCNGNPDETQLFLLRKKYVVRYHPVLPDGIIDADTFWAITTHGKDALEEYERQMCEKCAEEKSNEEKVKAQRFANRFDMLTFGTISATIAAIIAGIVVYYWPDIVAFLRTLLQSITSNPPG